MTALMSTLLSTINARPYAEAVDLPAIAHLMNTCITADRLDGFVSVETLESEFSGPDFDCQNDLRCWESSAGDLCAVAKCWFPPAETIQDGFLSFHVHPALRGNGLESDILAWAEARVQTVARDRHVSACLHANARTTLTERVNLLKQHDFVIVRSFYRMARSLTEAIAQPQLPAGYTVRPLAASEVTDWVEMFNQTFIDHWNFHPLTVESRQHWMDESDYNPTLDLVAIAPDSTFAAFCYSLIEAQTNAHQGRKDGWIADLGTRRGFRKQGLGRAMLLLGLQHLQAQGMDTAILSVDTQNPSGALRLYESEGFQCRYTVLAFAKNLPQ